MTTPSDDPEGPEEPQGKDRVQARIDQLTRQKHDAERATAAQQQRIDALTQQVSELTNAVTQSRRQTGEPADDLSSLLGTSRKPKESASPAPSPEDLAGLVQSSVQEALAPLVQEREEAAKAQELFSEQQRSFQEASQFVPEIATQGSQHQQLFDQIWNSNPELQKSPNGPGLVVSAVAGILGESVRESKVQDSRKQAASSSAPVSPMNRLPSLPGKDASPEKAVSALSEKGAESGLNKGELAGLIGLKLGRARVSEE